MKQGFRNKKLCGLLALLLCVSLAALAVNAQAASKKSQAVKVYKKFLSGQPSNGKVAQHSVFFGD